MQKIILGSLPKNKKIILIISFLTFLLVLSVVWGIIFAETTPLAPTNLISPSVTTSSVMLHWTDNATNEDKFNLERKLSSDVTFTFLVQVGTDITNYTDSSITAGDTYDYRVQACLSGTGCSDYVTLYGILVPGGNIPTPPTMPSGLIGIPTTTAVSLTWTDNSSTENQFKIERKYGTATNFTFLAQVGTDITSYTDNAVMSGITYEYRIQACQSEICSDFNFSSIVFIPAGNTPPIAPSNLISTAITTSSVTLHWTDNSSTENQFKIERKYGTATVFTPYAQVGTDITSYVDNSVTAGVTYEYQVKACYSEICSTFSNTLSVPIPGGGGGNGNTTPATPSNLILLNTTVPPVHLTWTDNSTEDSFKIERKLSTASSYVPLGQVGTNITTYTDTSVSFGVTYDYRVRACFQNTCSDFTILSGILIPITGGGGGGNGNTAPIAPSDLSATKTATTISLTWIDNSTNESHFRIEKKLSTATTTSFVLIAERSANVIYYLDTVVTQGVSYDYRVQACLSGSGCSDYDNINGIIIPGNIIPTTIPTAPSGLSLLNNTIPPVKLHWVDNSNNENKFNIERKLSTTSNWLPLIQITTTNTTSYTDFSVVPGVTYDYRVQACLSGTGCSGYSTLLGIVIPLTITPPPIIPIPPAPPIIPTPPPPPNLPVPNLPATISPTVPPPVPIAPTPPPVSIPTTTTSQTSVSIITTQTSTQIQDLGLAVEQFKKTINDTKEELKKLINEDVADIVKNINNPTENNHLEKIYVLRDELFKKVDFSMSELIAITPLSIDNLRLEIKKGLDEIRLVAGQKTKIDGMNKDDIGNVLDIFSGKTQGQTEMLKKQNGDLLYKDSNKDGISDYDSVYVFKMNPNKPSPISMHEGKIINASEKVLLGFDPTQSDLVKVKLEEPTESNITAVSTFKIKEVSLTEKKEIIVKGQALPNSFVTIYIYSTPIMVTVKTDNNGEWQYVLDKELENGDHTVYTATVNNTGNIVAKSSGYVFIKTAEAVTLKDIPITEASPNLNKPKLLNNNNLLLFLIGIFVVVVVILILIGISNIKSKKEEAENKG